MVNNIIMFIAGMLFSLTLHAQTVVVGTVQKVQNNTITIGVTDEVSNEFGWLLFDTMMFTIADSTVILGCNIQDVQQGAQCAITFYESPSRTSLVASTIEIPECAERFAATVTLKDVTGTSARFTNKTVSLPFAIGSTVNVVFTEQTLGFSCGSQSPLPLETFNNSSVLISGYLTDSNTVTVSYVQSYENCPQIFAFSGEFLRYTSEGIVILRNGKELPFTFPAGADGKPDSLAASLETCSWETFSWSQLLPQDSVYIEVLITPELRTVTSTTLLRTCQNPPLRPLVNVDGIVTRASSTELTVTNPLGEEYTIPVGANTSIVDCSGLRIAASDVLIGANVSVLQLGIFGLPMVDTYIDTYVVVQQNCTLEEQIEGILVGLDDKRLTLQLASGRRVALTIDNSSLLFDCMYQQIAVGDTSVLLKPIRVISTISTMADETVEARLVRGQVLANCATYLATEAEIVAVTDNALRIESANGAYEIPRSAVLSIQEATGELVDWERIIGKRNEIICATLALINDRVVAASISLVPSCSSIGGFPVSFEILGVVDQTTGAQMVVTTEKGNITIGTTTETTVVGAANVAGIAVGSRVYVQYNRQPQTVIPLATKVAVVNQSTSVEELRQWDLFVYPNPSFGTLNVSLPADVLRGISVIGIDGKEVAYRANTNTISIPDLASGVYTVLVRLVDGTMRTGRVSVMR
jgi:hypothetical protein